MARNDVIPRGRHQPNDYAMHLNSYRSVGEIKALGTFKLAIQGRLEAHFGPTILEKVTC